MRNLIGIEDVDFKKIDKRVVLVANDLTPAETSQIQLELIKGFVTNHGGKTSHTSIIDRTLGIPSVLGLEKATSIIKNDDIIIVDGISGQIIINPTKDTLLQSRDKRKR